MEPGQNRGRRIEDRCWGESGWGKPAVSGPELVSHESGIRRDLHCAAISRLVRFRLWLIGRFSGNKRVKLAASNHTLPTPNRSHASIAANSPLNSARSLIASIPIRRHLRGTLDTRPGKSAGSIQHR